MDAGGAVRLLAALYAFQGEGTVSALDTYGPNIYVGFESGTVQKLKMSRDSSGQIQTNLLYSTTTGKKHKVKRISHSENDPVLFVLSHRRLFVLSSDDLSWLRDVAMDVSAFTVSIADTSLKILHEQQQKRIRQQQQQQQQQQHLSPRAAGSDSSATPRSAPNTTRSPRTVEPATDRPTEVDVPRVRTARGTSSHSLSSPYHGPQAAPADGEMPAAERSTDERSPSPPPAPPPAVVVDPPAPAASAPASPSMPRPTGPKVHRVCCCLRDERRVVVYEYTYDKNKRPKKRASSSAAPDAAGDAEAPSPRPTDATRASFASVAGTSVSERPTPGDDSIPPNGRLVALEKQFLFPERVITAVECNGVLCVGMAREYSVVSIVDGDVKGLLSLNGEEPAISLFDNDAYLRLNNVLLVSPAHVMPASSKQALRKTIPFEHRPTCFTVRHGLVFGFNRECCEVYSTYEEDVVQRVPVEDARLVSDRTFKDMVVCASRKQLWLVMLHDLRTRLLEMVSRYRVDDAADLLLRSNEPRLEAELKISSAFAHLRNGAPFEAMGLFSNLIDVREVLRYVPGLRPPCRLPNGSAVTRKLEEAVEVNVPGVDTDMFAVAAYVETAHPDIHAAMQLAAGDGASSSELAEEESFWSAWCTHATHDPALTTLNDAWTGLFARLPESPGPRGATHRAWQGTDTTLDEFQRALMIDVKLRLPEWLEARLLDADADSSRLSEGERRAAEFALIVLYVEQRDSLRLVALLRRLQAVRVCDVLGFLVERRQYRVLYAVLSRRCTPAAAAFVYQQHLDLSRLLETFGRYAEPLAGPEALTPDAGMVDAVSRAVLQRRRLPASCASDMKQTGCRHSLLYCSPSAHVLGTGLGVLTPPTSPKNGQVSAANAPQEAVPPMQLAPLVTTTAEEQASRSSHPPSPAPADPPVATESAATDEPITEVPKTKLDAAEAARPEEPGDAEDADAEPEETPVVLAEESAADEPADATADGPAAVDESTAEDASTTPEEAVATATEDAAPVTNDAAAVDEAVARSTSSAGSEAGDDKDADPDGTAADDHEASRSPANAHVDPVPDVPSEPRATVAEEDAPDSPEADLPDSPVVASDEATAPAQQAAEAENPPAAVPNDAAPAMTPNDPAPEPVQPPCEPVPSDGAVLPDDDLFFAAELGKVSHVASLLSQVGRDKSTGDPSEAVQLRLNQADMSGATPLHALLAACLPPRAACAPPLPDVISSAAFLVSRGAHPLAATRAGVPAALVPFSRRANPADPLPQFPGALPSDSGWMPFVDSSRLFGAVVSGASSPTLLPV